MPELWLSLPPATEISPAGTLQAAFDRDPQFLERVSRTVLEGMTPDNPAVPQVIDQIVVNYVNDGLWDEAVGDVDRFVQAGYIPPGYRDSMVAQIEAGRAGYSTFLAQLRQD